MGGGHEASFSDFFGGDINFHFAALFVLQKENLGLLLSLPGTNNRQNLQVSGGAIGKEGGRERGLFYCGVRSLV